MFASIRNAQSSLLRESSSLACPLHQRSLIKYGGKRKQTSNLYLATVLLSPQEFPKITNYNGSNTFYSTKTSKLCFTEPCPSLEKTHLQTENITRISFMTDAEGDAAYFDRFIEQSKVLYFVPQSEKRSRYGDRIIRFKDDTADKNNDTKREKRECINNSMFVFGGDTCDKGGSDLYVLRQLLSLRERYPDRVFFIMGNRDINKLRISHEMTMGPRMNAINSSVYNDIFEKSSLTSSLQSLPNHAGCWWLRGSDRVGDPDSKLVQHRVPTHASDRLKWILSKTMGSPDAFEFRKQELKKQLEKQQPHSRENNKTSIVTDDDVVNSYIETCQPDGLMGEYLRHARLTLQIGKVMFMHGSLPLTQEILRCEKETFDKFHNQSQPHKKRQYSFWHDQLHRLLPWNQIATSKKGSFPFTYDDIKHKSATKSMNSKNPIEYWLKELENFKKKEIQSWSENIMNAREASAISKSLCVETKDENIIKLPIWATRGGYENAKSGESLMQYGMGKTPDFKSNPTVVYSSWSINGKPKISHSSRSNSESLSSSSFTFDMSQTFLRLLSEFFMISNLDVIITGHQPHGDSPLPMQINCSSPTTTMQEFDNDSTITNDLHNSDYLKDNKNKVVKNQDQKKKKCWVMSCDTSFSGDTHWIHPQRKNLGRETSLSGRGNTAVSEVIIDQNLVTGKVTNLFSHGMLSDGTYYESQNVFQTDKNNNNEKSESSCYWIGKVVHKEAITFETNAPNERKETNVWKTMNEIIEKNNLNEWCVKCKLSDGRYLVTSAKGYDVWNAIATDIKI